MAEDPEVAEARRRFDKRDFDTIAAHVCDTYETRKTARRDLEKQWKEIDRQIAMEPDVRFKQRDGRDDPAKVWMTEMELPLQAQALEVLDADAERMMFPTSGSWFRAHAELTDEWLETIESSSIIKGDRAELPSLIDQDNADKLVEGFVSHHHRQVDFISRMGRINAEAFRYGMGVGRARRESKNVFIHEARGVRKETQRIPVLQPASIRNLYLDDPMPSMHSVVAFGESHIAEDWIRLENLQVAANRGSTDPMDEDGGWMPARVKDLTADDKGYVRLLEMEGDLIVPRKTVRSVVIPGAIVTVAEGGSSGGGGQGASRAVVRLRFRRYPFSSYILFPYHYEGATGAYPTSPLMKGRTVQIMAVSALNRLLDSAALKNAPPVGYDRSNQAFAESGGPVIEPNAMWPTIDPVQVYAQVGGDPAALAQVLTLSINLYAELTGVLPARLGAQTVSHTTAFAKDAEISRGAARTVSYVQKAGKGGLERWLDMAYRMGRDGIGQNETVSFWIDAYGGFVEVGPEQLPETAVFEWFGAGGPAEEQAKRQSKLTSATLAMQIDQMGAAFGREPTLDLAAFQREVLREGGWTDVDTIVTSAATGQSIAPAAPGGPVLPDLSGLAVG